MWCSRIHNYCCTETGPANATSRTITNWSRVLHGSGQVSVYRYHCHFACVVPTTILMFPLGLCLDVFLVRKYDFSNYLSTLLLSSNHRDAAFAIRFALVALRVKTEDAICVDLLPAFFALCAHIWSTVYEIFALLSYLSWWFCVCIANWTRAGHITSSWHKYGKRRWHERLYFWWFAEFCRFPCNSVKVWRLANTPISFLLSFCASSGHQPLK